MNMKKGILDMKRNVAYIKVGSFFLVALVILFITLLSIREANFFRGTYILKAKFTFAEGLRPSSPVRFCGVDVGEVKKVIVQKGESRPEVMIFAKIQKGIQIPQNSYFFINSLSLFGEKYLEIAPPQEISGYLGAGEIVEGVSPIPLFNLFVTVNKTMREISDFVKEGRIKTAFENSLINLEEATAQMKGLVTDIRSKQGTIGKLLYDDSLYTKTEEFIEDIKQHPWKLLHKTKERKAR